MMISFFSCTATIEEQRKEQQEIIYRCQKHMAEVYTLLKQATEDMRKYELAAYQFLRNLVQDTKNIAEIYEFMIKFNGKDKTEQELEQLLSFLTNFFNNTIKATFLPSGPEEAGLTEEEFKAPVTFFSLEKIRSQQDIKKLAWKYAAVRASGEFMLFLNTFNLVQKYVFEFAELNDQLRDAERALEILQ